MAKTKKTSKVNHNKGKIHYQQPKNHKFSVEFVRATIYLYHVFHEIDQAPLIAWFEDFDKAEDPEKELAKWLHMANCFQLLAQEEPKNTEKHKKIYKVLLNISTGITQDELITPPNETGLNDKEIIKIYNTYNSIK